MKPHDVIDACERMRVFMEERGYHRRFTKQIADERKDDLVQFDHTDRIELMNHLFYMCDETVKLVNESTQLYGQAFMLLEVTAASAGNCGDEEFKQARARMEKAMRWLGFIQGMLVAGGVCSITQMKKLNSADEEA